MHKAKISYIVQSSIGIGIWALLSVIVSIKVASAEQLALATKIAIWGFLWGSIAYCIYVLVRRYRKLDEYDLNSNDKA
jgi:hypothetical protein